MRQLLLVFLSLFCIQSLFSQVYVPIDTANFSVRKDMSKNYLEASKAFITSLSNDFSGKEKLYAKNKFDRIHKQFNEELLHGDFIFDKRFDNFMDSLLTLLRAKNPTVPADLKFYISRNLSLNAASMGDNTFMINLGTFYCLDNENQLIAVIAHELGHYLLKHRLISLKRNFKLDKIDSKLELSSVKENKYNRGSKALESLKSLLYSEHSLIKQSEFEADSVGYILYKNAGFSKGDYLKSYQLLALYDSIRPSGLEETTYQTFFNLPNLKFKAEWLKREDFSAYDYSKFKDRFNKDSLSSHPETVERIDRLKKLFPELADSTIKTVPKSSFKKLQRIAEMEQAPCLDFNEAYGNGVYLCLLNLQNDSTNQYYREWLGRFFKKIYDARKTYTLNRYLDRVDPTNQSESYQLFICFMWNLNVNELKAIADYYNKKDS